MSEIFNMDIYLKARRPVSLWTKFLLLFRPLRECVDITPEITVKFWFKQLNGVTYFMDSNYKRNNK